MITLETLIEELKELTDCNDHTGAIVRIAEYTSERMKHDSGTCPLKNVAYCIRNLHQIYGHMPSELNTLRVNLKTNCFDLLGVDVANQINKAL